jgi:hypothetical protein
MLRKNFAATGSFISEHRPPVLDYMGVRSQLMFNTFYNSRLFEWDTSGDRDLAGGSARAHNRGMLDFCSVDERLLATAYVPFSNIDLAIVIAREAIESGAAASSLNFEVVVEPLETPTLDHLLDFFFEVLPTQSGLLERRSFGVDTFESRSERRLNVTNVDGLTQAGVLTYLAS